MKFPINCKYNMIHVFSIFLSPPGFIMKSQPTEISYIRSYRTVFAPDIQKDCFCYRYSKRIRKKSSGGPPSLVKTDIVYNWLLSRGQA